MENEIWKNVVGYEGLYICSNNGEIRSIKRDKIKKKCYNKGYLQVNLCKNGVIKTHPVHKIIVSSFLGVNSSLSNIVIDHINNIKDDNRLCNLQLITQRENTVKSKNNIFIGATKTKRGKWMSRIRLGKKYKYIGLFDSQKEAHEAYKKRIIDYPTRTTTLLNRKLFNIII